MDALRATAIADARLCCQSSEIAAVMPKSFLVRQLSSSQRRAPGPDRLANAVLRIAPEEAARVVHPLTTKAALRRRGPLGFKGAFHGALTGRHGRQACKRNECMHVLLLQVR